MLILVFFLYMLFALTFTLAKSSVLYMAPLFFISIRMLIAGIIFLSYVIFFDKKVSDKKGYWPQRNHLFIFFRLIFFHIFCAYVFEFWALPYVTSYKTAFIFNASPFITVLLLKYVYKEQSLTLKKIIGLIIGFIGFLPILLPQVLQEENVGAILFFSYPELALLIAVVSSCYGWLIFKELVHTYNYAPLMVNGIGMFFGGLFSLIVWFMVDGSAPLNPAFPWQVALYKSIFFMSMLILIANTVCYNLYGMLLGVYSPTFLSFAGFITPLLSAFFGWLFLNEPLSWHFLCAVFLVFIGLFIFYQDELLINRSITIKKNL